MSEWRHVEHYGDPAGVICTEVVEVAGYICGCTTPTPDPSSPCGWGVYGMDGYLHPCGLPDSSGHGHPYLPTCCTCGHSIEPVR